MITRIVLLPLQVERQKEFELLFNQIRPIILSFEGCISLELLEEKASSVSIANRFTYSKWQSEDALQKYLESDFFLVSWPLIKNCLHSKAQAWTLHGDIKN